MISKKKLTGVVLAISAAATFAMMPVVASANHHDMVKCMGVNSCKGKGSCKTSENSCKAKNSCKGKGVMPMSKAKCEKKGGTVMEEGKAG